MTKYYLGDQNEKKLMGDMGGEERGIQCFGSKTLGKEPLGRSRRRRKSSIKNVSSSNRDKRRAVVNAVVNCRLA
jgi:hypothetical protein